MFVRDRQKQTNYEQYSSEQVSRVLQACGINIVSEIETDYIIYCIYHNNFRTPAAEVSKETGQFFCFGCQESKTLTELVMFSTKRSYFETMRLIESKATGVDIVNDINSILSKPKDEFVEFDMDTINRLNEAALHSARAAEYYKSRKITKDSVVKYKLGYSEKQDMVTIPVTSPNGIYIGFVARSIDGKEFKNSTGLPRSKTLFNLSNVKTYSRIFLVESSFDAIRLEQVGAHAVASLGASINKNQKDLLKKYFTSIILVSDNDEAGRAMSEKLKDYFGNSIIIGNLPSNIKDVSDMDNDELSRFVSMFDDEISYILQ